MVSKEAAQAENLRKLLLAVSKDVRVLLVKLADRLHNMRTLEHVPADKRQRIAQETVDIYAPLAGRMGMQTIREELEDLSFKVLNPEAYRTIADRLKRLRRESGNMLLEIEDALKKKLEETTSRPMCRAARSGSYSIWRKMDRKQLSLGQLSDIFGFRVLVNTVDECYRALGIAHRTWRVVPGRFKDYISNPKQNDYRSIHTTVIGPHHMRVEPQIRTFAMHEIAERGVAAHGLYKDIGTALEARKGVRLPATESNAYRWLRRLVDILSEGDNPKEFLEHTKLELFSDQVFCFTPKGDLIALPKGANAIDFAYAVHTDIGNSCVGCRINGRHAPLMTDLENGDEVEIIRSKAQTPPAAWEGLAVTGKARAAIRRATRMAVRNQYAGLGREIMQRVLARHEHDSFQQGDGAGLPQARHQEHRGRPCGGRPRRAVERRGAARPRRRARCRRQATAAAPSARRDRHQRHHRSRPRRHAADPDLAGHRRRAGRAHRRHHDAGEGVTVYPIFSKALSSFEDEPDRWIDLAWDTSDETRRYPARIKAVIHNEVGGACPACPGNRREWRQYRESQMTNRAQDFFDIDLVIEVHDLRHLNSILQTLRSRPLISSVHRVTG